MKMYADAGARLGENTIGNGSWIISYAAYMNIIPRIQEDISDASVIFGVKQVCMIQLVRQKSNFWSGSNRLPPEGQDFLLLLAHNQGAERQHGPP